MVHAAVLLSVLTLTRASAAPALPSFEQSLGQLRGQVLATRQAQAKTKNVQDISNASWEARILSRETAAYKSRLSDIRRRAQQQRSQTPPREDPFLRSDARRLIWDLQSHARRAATLARTAQDLALRVTKDPDAVPSAQNLVWDAQTLRGESGWLVFDARFATWDLRAAGLVFEGMDIERASGDAEQSARDAERSANDILAKVR